ncbi:MAG: alkaline phosphatase family protein [bacterium]
MKLRWQLVVSGMALILGAGLFWHCGRWFKPATPKLAVVIVVDQMRYDYLVRFAGLFSGGLAKLWREGAVFSNAHHDHANTETAPGHATLLTGSYPSHHGIVANDWHERQTGRKIYCVDDSNKALVKSGDTVANDAYAIDGKGPHRLQRHTLGDWLKAKYPRAKVISISGKDRSAILMAGFEADAAYWFYAPSGGFVSSRYYLEALPAWAANGTLRPWLIAITAKPGRNRIRKTIILSRAKICSTPKATASTAPFRTNLSPPTRWPALRT